MEKKTICLAILVMFALIGSGTLATAFIDLRSDSLSMSSQTEDYKTIKFKIRNYGTDGATAPFYSEIWVDGTSESNMTHTVTLNPQPWWRWCYHTFYYSPDGSYLTQVEVDSTNKFEEPDEDNNWCSKTISYL